MVAAMTLPALINNTQNKQLETALKKAYSNLGQVTQRVVQEDFGGVLDIRSAKELSSYFVKYYNNGNVCDKNSGNNGCPTVADDGGFCTFMKQSYKTYNGKSRAACVGNDAISNTVDSTTIYFDAPNFAQPDLEPNTLNQIIMVIDVNGWQKRPNKLGHDMFMFQITQNGKLLPMGADGTSYPAEEFCSLTSTSDTNGYGCTVNAFTDKDYFKNLPK